MKINNTFRNIEDYEVINEFSQDEKEKIIRAIIKTSIADKNVEVKDVSVMAGTGEIHIKYN